jgi:hypothetical protein
MDSSGVLEATFNSLVYTRAHARALFDARRDLRSGTRVGFRR